MARRFHDRGAGWSRTASRPKDGCGPRGGQGEGTRLRQPHQATHRTRRLGRASRRGPHAPHCLEAIGPYLAAERSDVNKITPADLDRVVSEYLSGRTMRDVAGGYGCRTIKEARRTLVGRGVTHFRWHAVVGR